MFIFSNLVNTTIASPVTSGATTITLSSSQGLPTLQTGQMMPMKLLSATDLATYEIVYATAINSTTLTVLRAQEGTAPLNWNVGDKAYCTFTNGTVANALGNPLNTFMVDDAVDSSHAPNLGQVQNGGVVYGGGIASGTITGGNIASGTITGGNIASGTVTGGNIAGSTITEGNIAGGAIHRAQLSTATASTGITIGSGANYTFFLVGGAYSYHGVSATGNGSGSGSNIVVFGAGGNAGLGALGWFNSSTGGEAQSIWINENYINSSPPYNFGEAFVYVASDKQGKIVGISAALDPTWAHHGSHSIVPTHWREIGKPGTKGYRRVPMVYQDMLDGMIFSEAMKDASRRLAFLKGELTKERGEVEITIDFKDLDKETHPHPFGSDSVARVVLMHPEGPLADRITDMLKAGHASEIVKMIEDGDLIIKGKGIIHPHAPSTVRVVKGVLR